MVTPITRERGLTLAVIDSRTRIIVPNIVIESKTIVHVRRRRSVMVTPITRERRVTLAGNRTRIIIVPNIHIHRRRSVMVTPITCERRVTLKTIIIVTIVHVVHRRESVMVAPTPGNAVGRLSPYRIA